MFDALKKFWFALNSANSTKALSMALVLGAVAGLIPTLSVAGVVIFLIAFIFRIHFGLFLLSFAFFSFVGFLLDPLFALLGKAVLTAAAFEGFFTFLYNLPLLKLTAFNNTIMTGSMLIALPVGVLLYLLAQKLFSLYRDRVLTRLGNMPVVGSFFYNSKKASKKQSLIRYSGVIAFSFVGLLIGAFVWLAFDPLIKYGIKTSLHKVTGKEVRIGSVDTKLFSGFFTLREFALIDPKSSQQIAAFDSLVFDFNPALLFDKKYVIDSLQIENLDLDAKTAAFIKEQAADAPAKKKQNGGEKEKSSIAKRLQENVKIPTAEEILDQQELQSVQKAKQLRQKVQSMQQSYEQLQSDFGKQKLTRLQDRAKNLGQKLQESKDPAALLEAKKEFESLRNDIKQYQKRYTNVYTDISKEYKTISADIRSLDDLAAKDAKRLKEKYSSPEGLFSVISLFTGGDMDYAQKAYNLYLKAKPYLQSAPAQKEQNRAYYRMAGQNVLYKDTSAYARVQIDSAKASGVYEDTGFNLVLTGYSSDQHKTRKPMLLLASAQSQKVQNLEFKLLNNRFEKPYKTTADLKVEKLGLKGYESSKLLLKEAQSDILADAQFDLDSDRVTASADVYFEEVSLQAKASEELSNALSVIDDFDLRINADLGREDKNVDITSQSAQKISRLIAQEYIKEKSGLKQKLQAGIAEKMGAGDLQKEYAQVSKYLSTMQERKQSSDKLLETLTKQLKDKQKEGVNSKIQDKMKELF
ncbi:MAG: TIGR03545 family protein [Campylobacterota bacterium]